jgi:4-hydroxy-tetrahydrodipicolinate synthase
LVTFCIGFFSLTQQLQELLFVQDRHAEFLRAVELGARFRAGDHDGARRIDEELAPSIELLRVAPNPIAIKAALKLLGHDVGGHRLPLVEATEDERALVRDCLERLGVLEPARA